MGKKYIKKQIKELLKQTKNIDEFYILIALNRAKSMVVDIEDMKKLMELAYREEEECTFALSDFGQMKHEGIELNKEQKEIDERIWKEYNIWEKMGEKYRWMLNK